MPRLFWIEAEFRNLQREAELSYVRRLAREISSGALDGVDWWRDVHARGDAPAWLPPPLSTGQAGEGSTESNE